MRWIGDLWFRVRAVFERDNMERDLDDEFAFHLDMEAAKYEDQGMEAEEAIRKARLKFGGTDRFREHARESWGVSGLTDLGADLRFARRQLIKNPALSALAIATLALGIGGTVALFSVVNGLMLRPLPFPAEDRVVSFWADFNWRGEEFDLVKDLPRSFEGLAAYSNDAYTLATESGSSLILATVTSVELFDVLGASPFLGRTFQAGEDRPGSEPVVVLAHGLWQREFGADRTIVGRRINIGGVQRTVIGVMPKGFYFPSPEMEVFVPLNLDPDEGDYAGNGWLVLTGRMREGVTSAQIQDDLALVTQALGERYDYPEAWDKTRNAHVVPIRDYLLGDVRPAVLLLLGAVGLLLLMSCVNVAALILTKTVDRTREMAVRAALGAGRDRLARQVLTESVVLGLLAGTVGLGLAVALFDVLVTSLPIDPAFRETLGLDWTTLLAAFTLSIVTGCVVGLAPIRNLLRGDLGHGAFGDRTGGSGAAHASKMQRGLVVAEVLLAVVMITGASLLVRTVAELRGLDPGFDPEGVLAVGLILPEEETVAEERAIFFDALLERTHSLPGVTHAGYVNRVPLRDGGWQGPVGIDGRADLEGANRPGAMYRPMSPDVFGALGVAIVEGRGLEPTDRAEGPLVAVVNETFARKIWGASKAVGRTYTTGFVGQVEVVGVVRDIAVTELMGEQPMTAYYPWDQSMRGASNAVLMVKTDGDPARLAGPIRTAARELDRRAALGRVQTMGEVIDAEMVEPLRLRFFLGLLGALGLVLGTVGVYGVVSYSVQRRQTEFGIRLALGAEPRGLRRRILLDAMRPVIGGVVAGTLVALLASRVLANFLFGVSATDPLSFLFASGTLLLAGVCAATIPAIRASAADPATALRAD